MNKKLNTPSEIGINAAHTPEAVTQSTNERKGKLIIVSTVHYRDIQGQIQSSNCRISRSLDSKDTSLKRTMIVGKDWVKINTGWIKDVGYLMITNLGGNKFTKTPTPEQVSKAKAQIVEIGIRLPEGKLSNDETLRAFHELPPLSNDCISSNPISSVPTYIAPQEVRTIPLWLIHPYECFQGKPIPNLDLWIRCQLGEVSITYLVVPQ